jgi:antitoxin component YwqK of YwqJK toxin-antitoxin module
MKTLAIAFFASLLLFGCGSPDLDDPKKLDLDDPKTLDNIIAEAIYEERLQKRGKKGEELSYAPNMQMPYTGWVKDLYENGQVEELSQFKDGKKDGLWTTWYEHGQKEGEANFKDGKTDGLWTTWYENGQKMMEGNFEDDKMDGPFTQWYENGQKSLEGNSKDGKLVTANVWKPNGVKCPITNVVGGNGVRLIYNGDGTEDYRETFKNGKIVKD